MPEQQGLAPALAKLDDERARYSAEFTEACRTLAAIERRYLDTVRWHYRRLENARCDPEIASVGRRRSIRLHATKICSGNAEFALCGDVSAQVVPGTGVAQLYVSAPAWGFVEALEVGIDVKDIAELASFAELIGQTAQRLSSTKHAMAERTRQALAVLRLAVEHRAEVHHACARVVAAAEASAALDGAFRAVTAAVEAEPRRRLRAVRRARRSLAAARAAVDDAQRVASAGLARVERQAVEAAAFSRTRDQPERPAVMKLAA